MQAVKPGEQIHTQAIADFYMGYVLNDAKTHEAGRPIYDDQERIRIRWAGNTKSEFHAPASDRSDRPVVNPIDKSRHWPKWKDHPDFKAAYDAFKAGLDQAVNGTPISELPFLTEARRAELKAVNIFTAETLANLDDKTLGKLGMDMRSLKMQAQAFLERAAGAAVDAKHAAEMDALRREMEALRAQVSGASAAQGKAEPAKAKKAGDYDAEASPFWGMGEDDIRNWLTDADPDHQHHDKPHHKAGKATLCKLADQVNDALRRIEQSRAA